MKRSLNCTEQAMNISQKLSKKSLVDEIKTDFPKFLCKHDDFMVNFDSSCNLSCKTNEQQNNLKNLLKYTLTYHSPPDRITDSSNLTEDEDETQNLLEVFKTQASAFDIELLKETIEKKEASFKKLMDVNYAFEQVLNKNKRDLPEFEVENKKLLHEIKKGFIKRKNLLDNIIAQRFPQNTEKYRKVLEILIDNYFEDKTRYVSIPLDADVIQNDAILSLVQINPINLKEYRLKQLY